MHPFGPLSPYKFTCGYVRLIEAGAESREGFPGDNFISLNTLGGQPAEQRPQTAKRVSDQAKCMPVRFNFGR